MGKYLNPKDMTKEQWLAQNATKLPELPSHDKLADCFAADGKSALVCWMNNGPFTACAHVYDDRELEEFSRSDDRRPKAWFVVDRALAEAMFR